VYLPNWYLPRYPRVFTELYFPCDSLKANASLKPTKFFCKKSIDKGLLESKTAVFGAIISFDIFGFLTALINPKNKKNKNINFLIIVLFLFSEREDTT